MSNYLIMANPLELLKPKASLDRNGFPLSERHIYSSRAGLVQVVKALDLIPDDYIEGNLLSLCRTAQPVVTDAFARMTTRFIIGFVPYQQIWSHWNDFILQTRENFSRLTDETLPTNVPYVQADGILVKLAEEAYATKYASLQNHGLLPSSKADFFGFAKYQNAARMLDMLEYGAFYDIVEAAEWYAQEDFDNGKTPDNTDSYYYTSLSQKLEVHITNAYSGVKWNVFRVAAYQKFCTDYMRSVVYEKPNPNLFNFDSSNGSIQVTVNGFYDMLAEMWYALHKKDMFTSLLPSAQAGLVSSVDLGVFSLKAVNSNSSSVEQVRVQRTGEVYNSSGGSALNYDFTSSASIDVYQLRKAEMFQKWKEDKLRAGSKLIDQAASQWGVNFHYLADKYSQYIQEVSFNISIDEVVNQSGGASGQLGDIAGKGIGTGSGNFKFHTNDFGTLLILQVVTPVCEYDNLGTNKDVTLMEPFDFVTPVFENLGLESVHGYQLKANDIFTNNGGIFPSHPWMRKTLGFGSRYLNKKVGYDRVHGEFMATGHADLTELGNRDVYQTASGKLCIWTTPRQDMETSVMYSSDPIIPVEFLKINPRVLDTIFSIPVGDGQDTDQFLFNTNIQLNAVRSLSVTGLPRW